MSGARSADSTLPRSLEGQQAKENKMDFLFTPLPETNFQMSDDELRLWQRNAIFECECDNFINRRVESTHPANPTFHFAMGRPLLTTAIEAAINSYGLQATEDDDDDDDDDDDEDETTEPPPTQRRRLNGFAEQEPEVDSTLEDFYEEAIAMAIRDRGLRKNP